MSDDAFERPTEMQSGDKLSWGACRGRCCRSRNSFTVVTSAALAFTSGHDVLICSKVPASNAGMGSMHPRHGMTKSLIWMLQELLVAFESSKWLLLLDLIAYD